MAAEYQTEDVGGDTVLVVSDTACLTVAEEILFRLEKLLELEERDDRVGR